MLQRSTVAVLALLPCVALASIGKADIVEAEATRTAKGGATEALKAGTALELGDTVKVKKGNVKLVLTDESVLMMSEGSELVFDEASFEGQERKGVSLRLILGALYSHVKKGAKYEVMTERAAAGVRGTEFRVDVLSADHEHPESCVCVFEGAVGVWAGEDGAAKGAAAPKGKDAPPASIARKGWTPKFTEVKVNQQLFARAKSELKALEGHKDAFTTFILAHR